MLSSGDNRFEVELRSSNKLFSKKPILQVIVNLVIVVWLRLYYDVSSFFLLIFINCKVTGKKGESVVLVGLPVVAYYGVVGLSLGSMNRVEVGGYRL